MKNILMTKFNLIISLSLLLSPLPCFANDSNLEDFNYPPHECGEKIIKPTKPSRITSYKDVDDYNNAVTEYNINVTTYNKEIRTYKSCINQYIKNGNHDMNIIRKELNEALKDARAK